MQTFFVISGFLITHLLLKELNTTGTVNLKRFYFRRALRIFPPFYVYLAVALSLTLLGSFLANCAPFSSQAPIPGTTWVQAVSWWNTLGRLVLEEQFYLLWPAALVLLGARKSVRLAVCVILLSPLSRIITYYVAPHQRALLNAMLHTGLDSIMFGCLLALLWRNPRFNRFVQPLVRGWVAAFAAAFTLILSPVFLQAHFRGSYTLVFGFTLNALCLSQILIYVVRNPHTRVGRLLNTPALRHLGVISYSLYLWQQPFTRANSVPPAPWNLLAILACAEMSYWLIERPSFRLRDRLEQTLSWKRSIAVEPARS